MPSNSRENKKEDKRLHLEIAKQMVALSTAGFGLVAALAWNSLIQEFMNTYVKRWIPGDGKIISLLIYALIVTILAVTVTLQLSKIVRRIEKE
ncbi:MAG: DUF5654 family protein [Patescibacteria group bacterium]